MYQVTRYPHGTFCWVDINTTDQSAGEHFYADLMGWTITRQPMGGDQEYTQFLLDGAPVAGMGPMPQGAPPMAVWNSYINVEDVDALVEQVKALGGTVVFGPIDVFDQGRMMTIQDPSGAFVALWQAKEHIGSHFVNRPGAVAWNELATRDPQAAMTFFGGLLGWEFKPGTEEGYYNISNQGRMNGGIITMTAEWAGMPPHWMIYFSVADIDAVAAKAVQLGGKQPMPITDIPNMGRLTLLSDPQGAHFTVMHVLNPESWTE